MLPQAKKTNQDVLNEKVMKLELAVMMLISGLRCLEKYPTPLLDRVEKLITTNIEDSK